MSCCNCECESVQVTEDGFKVGSTQYFNLSSVASKSGMHPDSINRLWRYSGDSDQNRVGVKLRGLFFTEKDMEKLNHPFKKTEKEKNGTIYLTTMDFRRNRDSKETTDFSSTK